MNKYGCIILCFCFLFISKNGWGQLAVHDEDAVGGVLPLSDLDTKEEYYTEKTILYIEEILKYNKEILNVIGTESALAPVRLEWARDDDNAGGKESLKNLLNLKYFIPWVPVKHKEKLSKLFSNEERGMNGNSQDPTDPQMIEKSAQMIECLLLDHSSTSKEDATKICQAKQMLASSLHSDAVALTVMQVPVSVPKYSDMNNIQEIYGGMNQLVLAQQGVLNEVVGLHAVQGQPAAMGKMYMAEHRTDQDTPDEHDKNAVPEGYIYIGPSGGK